MTQPSDEGQLADNEAIQGQLHSVKKPYVSPGLVEYGSIVKLTQTGTVAGTDGTVMMSSCL